MMAARPASWAYPPIVASMALISRSPSMSRIATSLRSRCLCAIITLSRSGFSLVQTLRRMPAVSTNRKRRPSFLDEAIDSIPGRSRDGRDHRPFFPDKEIQQGGLARVRSADDRNTDLVGIGSNFRGGR